MALSARNRLRGTVTSVERTDPIAEVTVELDGGEEVTSIITTASVERLDVDVGDEVSAVVKATDVMIQS